MRGRELTGDERETISRGIAAGDSGRQIGAWMGRHFSVVNREIARGGGRAAYRAGLATAQATARAKRPKLARLVANRRLHDVVAAGLALAWSPAHALRPHR